MKLLYSPGACSVGIHTLLEEIGRPYETEKVDLAVPVPERGLTRVNPKSKVPTLVRDDGSVLTEYPAIAFWLARTNPAAKLLPDDIEGQTRTMESLDYCVSTVHMQGFGRMFGARRIAEPAQAEAMKAAGREIAERGFARLSATLGAKDWLAGSFSVADSALFYVCTWANNVFKMEMPANLAAHFARMNARPAVQAALKQEALA